MQAAITKPLLIIGSSGQLGQDLVLAGRRRHLICRRAQRQAGADSLHLDLSTDPDFDNLLRRLDPCCVVNAAAYTAVDAAEKEADKAWQVNTRTPGRLAAACRQQAIPLVHFSTDYVFSGHQARAWREDDPCEPLGIYGKSKAQGEARIRDQAGSYFIFRSSWLYSPGQHNFVSTMLRLFAGQNPVRVVDDQHGCPTWTHYLAEAVIDYLQRTLPDSSAIAAASGTYHLCAQNHTSWFGFAQAIAERAQPAPRALPQAITSREYPTPAPRPANSALDCSLAQQLLGLQLPDWRQQLDEAMPLFNAAGSGIPA